VSEEYRFIGKHAPRKDAVDIVTGRAKFIDDMKMIGMLHGKVLRSPYPHAKIKSIDTGKAEALSGVESVLTYKNVPDWKGGTPRIIPILDRKVRYVGDAVALVAAKSEEIAEEAMELIDVKYEQLPAVYDTLEAMKHDAPQLYSEFPGNTLPLDALVFGPTCLPSIEMGDIREGFGEADFIGEGTCDYEGVPNPLAIEPPGVIAKWEGPNQLTLWSATQSATGHRLASQPRMGFPDIRSIGLHCGGSYGSKNAYFQAVFYAASLAQATGNAVKVLYTKEEQFGAFVLRLGSRFQGKVGIKKDGTVTAVSGEWIVGCGAFSDVAQGQIHVGLGEVQLMVRCPNWDLKPKLVCTNRCYSGTVRGFGGQEFMCALIPVLSVAMEQADLDPVEFFKKNYVKKGDGYYWRDGKWWVCRGVDYRHAIEKGAEVFGWKEKWKGWLKPTGINGVKRTGVGVGVHGNADVGEDVSEAYVRLNADATVTIHVCVSEAGMGQRSSLCKMAAEVLQLPHERINVTPADTLLNPFEFGLAGSRGTYAVGSAVIAAAESAKKELFEMAAQKLNVAPEDLETRNGRVHVKEDHARSISWSRIVGLQRTCTGFGRFEPDFSMPNFMMMFTEVEVDTETGKIELVRVVPATDVGQIIDPRSVEGQIHGSLGAAGLDTALFEESVLDKTTGHMLSVNMMDYKWRTFLELPEFNNVILESHFPTHRFKAVGIGEITTAPGPAAVLMAVSNAIGKRISSYPITPDRILKALGRI